MLHIIIVQMREMLTLKLMVINQIWIGLYRYSKSDFISDKEPCSLLSVLDVKPSVNSELIWAEKDKVDGKYMGYIQIFSWLTFPTQIHPNTTGLF